MRYAIGSLLRVGSRRARAPETVSVSPPAARTSSSSTTTRRVIVIGAGLAGLACAERLVRRGCQVTLLEATNRVGGRTRAIRDFVPGAVLEMGAEFVGNNHPLWKSYARRFGIPLLKAEDYAGQDKPILLRGQRVDRKEAARLWTESDALLRRLNPLAMGVNADEPWTSPAADELDHLSLQDWLDAQADVGEDVRTVAAVGMAGDNGLPCDRQSLLANLAMIKGGGMDAFWTDSEYYRAQGGNERLAQALLREIGEDRVRFCSPVKSVRLFDGYAVVECEGGSRYTADDVVLATPASVYDKIEFDPPLPKELEVQMGKTLKIMARVENDFWTKEHCAPEGLSDGLVSQVWDGTDGQAGARGASLNALCLPAGVTGINAAAVGRD